MAPVSFFIYRVILPNIDLLKLHFSVSTKNFHLTASLTFILICSLTLSSEAPLQSMFYSAQITHIDGIQLLRAYA